MVEVERGGEERELVLFSLLIQGFRPTGPLRAIDSFLRIFRGQEEGPTVRLTQGVKYIIKHRSQ